MSTEVQFSDAVDHSPTYESYRALCSAAVTSLLLGLLSAFAFLSPYLNLIPILGILMGVYALVQIRHRSAELTGGGLAAAGIVVSAILLIASIAFMTHVYLTEVPEGFKRIDYTQLQPEEGKLNQKVPPLVEELDGKQVFIKGYVFPGQQKQGIKTFLLVRDRGDCCFGGDPKMTDRIQVTLADPERLKFSSRLHKLAGTFRLERKPGAAVDATGVVYYYLDNGKLR